MNSSMMQFEGVAAIFAIFAIVCLFAGYKLLAVSSWLSGWLRGNIGIFFVILAGGLILCVMDVRTYKPMFDDQTVATLSLRETSARHYEVRLVDALGAETRYFIEGDNWQLTANQFRWSKRLSLGLGHGYRFIAIAGSNGNASLPVSEDVLSQSRYFDVWKFLNDYSPNNFLVSTARIVTVPQPLADAAMYEVVPLGFDLVVRPLNELAKRAQAASAQPSQTQSTGNDSTAIVPAAIETAPAAATTTVVPAVQEKPATAQ